MPLQSVRPATEQTASAVPGGGAGSNLKEEKLQAIKENLMGSFGGEVEDNLDDIDKDDLDEFLMNTKGEVNVNKEKENKNEKMAEGKRKRGQKSKEDKVSRKRRRGPKSEVSVFDQQFQTMSAVEVKDDVAAKAIPAAVDNEKGEGEVVSHLLNETVATKGEGEGSPNGRQRKLKSLPCDQCDAIIVGGWELRKHKKVVHQDQGNLTCEHCGKTFEYISILNKHVLSHSKTLQCEFCARRFSRKDHLKCHLSVVHSGEKGRAAEVFVHFVTR